MSVTNSIFFCAEKYIFDLYMNICRYFSCFKQDSKEEVKKKRLELLIKAQPKRA